MHPPCFSKTILYSGASLPSSGSARAAFPKVLSTMKALRLPASSSRSLMDSLPRSSIRLLGSLHSGGDTHHGLVPFYARYLWRYSTGRTQALPGSWRNPPLPLPRSSIPAESASACHNAQTAVAPSNTKLKASALITISGLNHAASVAAVYASRDTLPYPMQDLLPVGG